MFLYQAVAITMALATPVHAAVLNPISVHIEIDQGTSQVIARGLLVNPPAAAIIKSAHIVTPNSTELAMIDERASEAIWLAMIGQTGLTSAAIYTVAILAGGLMV